MNPDFNMSCVMQMIALFKRLSSWRSYAIITGLFLFFFFAVTGRPYGTIELSVITGGLQAPDLSFDYADQSVYSLLDSFGQAARDLYLTRILPLDTIFALTYLFFFAVTLGILIRYLFPARPELQYLVVVPVIGALADMGENVCFALVMMAYPAHLPLVIASASLITKLKFVCNYTSIFLIVLTLAASGILGARRLGKRG